MKAYVKKPIVLCGIFLMILGLASSGIMAVVLDATEFKLYMEALTFFDQPVPGIMAVIGLLLLAGPKLKDMGMFNWLLKMRRGQ